jgi:hypothetical protein
MDAEITTIELLLTRGRALGLSFWIVEQVLPAISSAARESAHLAAAFCPSASGLRAAAELLGLRDRHELEWLQNLGIGECIVSLTGNRIRTPVHLRIPQLDIDRSNLTKQERQYHIRRSLDDLKQGFLPRFTGYIEQSQDTKQRERDPSRLSKPAWRVFGMDRGEEEAARRECGRKGYIGEAGTFGRGIKFFYLLPKGTEFANRHNIPVTKFKSGVVHQAMLRRAKERISKACPSVRWVSPDGATGSIQPDAYGLLSDGTAVCIQIHHMNKTSYEIKALMELCKIEHVDIIVLIGPTNKAVASMRTQISKSWKDDIPKRYTLLSATECFGEDFDWVTIFEKPI